MKALQYSPWEFQEESGDRPKKLEGKLHDVAPARRSPDIAVPFTSRFWYQDTSRGRLPGRAVMRVQAHAI